MTLNPRVRLAAAALLAVQMTTLLLTSVTRPAFAAQGNDRSTEQIRSKKKTSLIKMTKRTKAKKLHQRKVAEKRYPRGAARLGHGQAMDLLQNAGIGWRSSGGCTDWRKPRCTSLHGIRPATLLGTIRLKERSGCPVTITGGTEVGHATGPMSHRSGHKIDISPNECLDAYIRRNFRYQGVRSDGAKLYRSGDALYARESNHWDIVFY